MSNTKLFSIIGVLLFYTTPSYSYIGPGLGVGILTLILGFILTILVALFTVKYFYQEIVFEI